MVTVFQTGEQWICGTVFGVAGNLQFFQITEGGTLKLILTVIFLAVLIISFYYLQKWIKSDTLDNRLVDNHKILSDFSHLRDEGEISEREYKIIKRLMADKIQND